MSSQPLYPAPPWRRFVAMLYEGVIVMAVLLLAALVFQLMAGRLGWLGADGRITGWPRHIYQLYLGSVLGLYFCWFWHHGETLAMRAWRLRLLGRDGRPPSCAAAACRYVAALALLGPTVAGSLWLREHPGSAGAWLALLPGIAALASTRFGADRSALYDRIASTRLIYAPRTARAVLRSPG